MLPIHVPPPSVVAIKDAIFSLSDYMLRLLEDSVDGERWDNFTQTPYFQYQLRYDNGSLEQHQVYYDNGRSLRLKYEYAKDSGVQGVAMWTANSIDNTNATQVDEFWSAVRSFIPSRLKVDDFEIAWNSPWPTASAYVQTGGSLASAENCPGRKPPKRAVKRRAHTYKSPIQNRFS